MVGVVEVVEVVVEEVVVVGHGTVVVGRGKLVEGCGTPSGSVLLIWRPSAVIAPTTTSTTSAMRIVYSSTDAPSSFLTSSGSFTRGANGSMGRAAQ